MCKRVTLTFFLVILISLDLGKPYVLKNLFNDCKTSAINEDVNKAVWFALSNYIFEKISNGNPEVLLNIPTPGCKKHHI